MELNDTEAKNKQTKNKTKQKTIMRFHFSLTILKKIKEVPQHSVGKGMKTDDLLLSYWSE